MLKSKNRLKKRKEFSYIYRKGEKIFSESFTIYVVKSKYNSVRFGVSVSNKVGNAVTRNKIKRQLRSILSKYTSKIVNKNIIISVKPEIVAKTYQEIENQMKIAFKKGKIVNE